MNRRRVRREVAVVPVEAVVSVDEMLVAESVRDNVVVVMLGEVNAKGESRDCAVMRRRWWSRREGTGTVEPVTYVTVDCITSAHPCTAGTVG